MFIVIQLLVAHVISQPDVCHVKFSRMRPCGPGISTTQGTCQQLGCCWYKNNKFGVPNCYHPVVDFQEQIPQAPKGQAGQTIVIQDRCVQQRTERDCNEFFQDGDRCLWSGNYCVVGNDSKCTVYRDEETCSGRLYQGKACFWNDYYCAEGDLINCDTYKTSVECKRAFHVGFTCIWQIDHAPHPTFRCMQDPKDYRDLKCADYAFEGDCAGQLDGLKTCKWVNDECVIHGDFDCESVANEKECIKKGCEYNGGECTNPVGAGSASGAEGESGGGGAVDCENEPDEETCNDFAECFWSHEEGECLDMMEAYLPQTSTSTSNSYWPPNGYQPQPHSPYTYVVTINPYQTQPTGNPYVNPYQYHQQPVINPYQQQPYSQTFINPYQPVTNHPYQPSATYNPYQPQPSPYQNRPSNIHQYSHNSYQTGYIGNPYLRKSKRILPSQDPLPSFFDSYAFRICAGVLAFIFSCSAAFGCVIFFREPDQLSKELMEATENASV